MKAETSSNDVRLLRLAIVCCLIAVICMYYSVWLFMIYGPLFLAAAIAGVIAMAQGRIWSGVATFLMASMLPGVLITLLMVLPSGQEIQKKILEWREGTYSFSETDHKISVGEEATTSTFELKVITVKKQKRVGSLFRRETSVDGASYILVTWSYRNISSAPVLPRLKPVMTLLSPDKKTYRVDVAANRIIAKKELIKGRTANSTNPGVKISRVDVFEVPKKVANKSGWKAVISADQIVFVEIE